VPGVEYGSLRVPASARRDAHWERGPGRQRRPQEKESVMGLGKKAKHKSKAAKGKTKKDARKVKHKGKKAKNAAKH
jgi:hypothetical protein